MSNFHKKIFLIVISIVLTVIIVVLQPLVVIGMRAFEVSEIAKKVTVSIEGFNPGSGVIIGKNNSNNNYQVMTSGHVLEGKGEYSIRTFDDKSHFLNIKSVQRMHKGIDIAIVEFMSETPYLVANVGDSNILKEGMTVFVAGYPTNGPLDLGRNYYFLESKITTLSKKAKNGYRLGYDNISLDGMSGGAVLNEDGKLVAIHGATEIRSLTGASGNYGIPSDIFRNWQQQIALTPQENTLSDLQVLMTKSLVCKQEELFIGSNIKFIWPTTGVLTSRFGRRWGKMNKGIDIAGPIGTPIYAAADGVVEEAGWHGAYGNLVVIRHVNGLLTLYGHLSKLSVEVDKRVNQGDEVALMGSTGMSTRSHLHFEIHQPCSNRNPDIASISSTAIDPIPFLPRI